MSLTTAVAMCKFSSPKNAKDACRIYEILSETHENIENKINTLLGNEKEIGDILNNIHFIITSQEVRKQDSHVLLLSFHYSPREDDLEIISVIDHINNLIENTPIFSLNSNGQIGEWAATNNENGQYNYVCELNKIIQDKFNSDIVSYDTLFKSLSIMNEINNTVSISHLSTNNHVNDSPYQIGQNVKHKDFGVGTVQIIEGTGQHLRAEIKFQNGDTKWLMLAYAKLQSI